MIKHGWGGDRGNMLALKTLGGLEIERDGTLLDGALPAKARALIAYLAVHDGQAARSTVAGLLWSDQTEERARANLRVVLSRIRAEAEGLLVADRYRIELVGHVTIDTSIIDASPPDADAIVEAFAGDFLYGVELPGAELFDDWLLTKRRALQAQALTALRRSGAEARAQRDWERCERLAHGIVLLEPWHETAHQWIVEARREIHGYESARRYFEDFANDLATEMGVEPSKAICDAVGPRPRHVEPALPAPPHHAARLVGRDQELRMLEELAIPGRVVSIVGPGGIGKSRLLAAFAEQRVHRGDAVAFVSLAGHRPTSAAETGRAIAQTVMASLGLPVDGEAGAVASLQRWLGQRELTLCLDNLEQFDQVEALLVKLIDSNPRLTVTVATRRRPALLSGRTVDLGGLAWTAEAPTSELSPAEELFFDRSTSRIDPDARQRELVTAICASLEGHPLAIELGAQWSQSATLPELADLLDRPISAGRYESFETGAPDIPPRHRSLDVVVEASVAYVSAAAQRVLRAAAEFLGPFDRYDLEALVPVATKTLTELVDHSLVARTGDRYRLHPVIRRFAQNRLTSDDSETELAERHAMRMATVLMSVDDPSSSANEVRSRSSDLRKTIDWMIEHADAASLIEPLERYLGYQRASGWVEASGEIITQALERRDLNDVQRACLRRHAAEALLQANRFEASARELEHGLRLVGRPIPASRWGRLSWNLRQSAGLTVASFRPGSRHARERAGERARLMAMMGELFYVSDQRAEMISYSLGSLRSGRQSNDPMLAASGDAAISIASQLAGAHRLSERYRQRARTRATMAAEVNPFTASETWGITAIVALSSGQVPDARDDVIRAIDAGMRSGRARMVSQLSILGALVDYHAGDHEQALERLEETEAAIAQHGFRRALTWVHATRAECLLQMGDSAEAWIAASQALETSAIAERSEDAARAYVALARCELGDGNLLSAHDQLRKAANGLRSPSAMAIQHFELHSGFVEVARSIQYEAGTRDLVTLAEKRHRAYARAFPAARTVRRTRA